jgi:hypothetical protein
MRIDNPSRDELDQLSRFIGDLIVQPEHRVTSYLGRSSSEVGAFLANELKSLPAEAAFVVARDNGRIVAALGVDPFPDNQLAYLMGPFIDHPDWDVLANRLWLSLRSRIPDGIRLLKVSCDEANTRCQRFLAARAFERQNAEATLELRRASHVGSARFPCAAPNGPPLSCMTAGSASMVVNGSR